MHRHILISAALFPLFLLGACASQPASAPAAAPTAERFYDCTDVNGPIGVLHLTGDGQALVIEPDKNKPDSLGPYQEQDGRLIIHNPDFGDMIYTMTADKLVSVAPPNSSLAADKIACSRKSS